MIPAVALCGLLGAGQLPGDVHLVPPLSPPAAALRAGPAPQGAVAATSARRLPERKSSALALGLTLAVELPTLFLGPSAGHAYAGEWEHFAITGGGRIADLALLMVLEKFVPGFGIGPLYAILHPEHLGATFAAYPVAFPIDLILVLALVGSGVYDAVDAWFAAARANVGLADAVPGRPSAPAAAAVPPPARP